MLSSARGTPSPISPITSAAGTSTWTNSNSPWGAPSRVRMSRASRTPGASRRTGKMAVPVLPPGLSVTFAMVTRRSAWGPPVTKDFTPESTKASPRLVAVVRGPSRASVKARAAVSSPLSTGRRKRSRWDPVASRKSPPSPPRMQLVENALRSRDLLVERDPAERPQPAAAQLEGLGQAIESELGRAGARPAPQRGSRLAFLHDLLPPLRGEHLVLEEAAQGFPERGEGGRELGIHATKGLRPRGRQAPARYRRRRPWRRWGRRSARCAARAACPRESASRTRR